jgi:hypothetical protein
MTTSIPKLPDTEQTPAGGVVQDGWLTEQGHRMVADLQNFLDMAMAAETPGRGKYQWPMRYNSTVGGTADRSANQE